MVGVSLTMEMLMISRGTTTLIIGQDGALEDPLQQDMVQATH
jgi:hypothetical protein